MGKFLIVLTAIYRVTIHDKVNLETSLSEQFFMTVTSDYAYTQVRMIHDSNRPAQKSVYSSCTSFAANWWGRCSNRMNWSEEMLAAFAERNRYRREQNWKN